MSTASSWATAWISRFDSKKKPQSCTTQVHLGETKSSSMQKCVFKYKYIYLAYYMLGIYRLYTKVISNIVLFQYIFQEECNCKTIYSLNKNIRCFWCIVFNGSGKYKAQILTYFSSLILLFNTVSTSSNMT